MKAVSLVLVFCYLLLFNSSTIAAQKVNNLLNKNEVALLDILSVDTINTISLNLDGNSFNFGLKKNEYTNIDLIKDKKNIWIQPLGTGRLYSINKLAGLYQITRIDSTIHSGASFYSYNFILRDTIFQYGGEGFWNFRGTITYFSKETHQWELYPANRVVKSYFDSKSGIIAHINLQNANPKLYISNSVDFENFPNTINMNTTDSMYMYDINARNWTTLGKIEPVSLKRFTNTNSHVFHFGDSLIYESELEFFWLNFSKNITGRLTNNKNTELRAAWLKMYGNVKSQNFSPLQFNLGSDIYLILISEENGFNYTKINLKPSDFDNANISPIYLNNGGFLNFDLFKKRSNISLLIIILLSCVIIYFSFKYLKNRKKLPKEVVSILNNNFYSALTIIEKELIDVLYQHHLKGEAISTKLINKIIGVQQKDILTQNKSRSDYFIRINQKYKMSTQQTEPLIVKNRDKIDKRQYNYSLNNSYIQEIEKMLKD
jgi:hypothetical protein